MKAHSSKIHPSLDRRPGISNWVDEQGGLPSYMDRIAKHIHYDSGLTRSHAIAAAVERVKVLAAKGNAQAIKALAQWNAKRAKAKSDNVKLAKAVAKPTKGAKPLGSSTSKNKTDEDRREQRGSDGAGAARSGAAGVRSTVAGQHVRTQNRGTNSVGSARQFDENKIVRDNGGRFGDKINAAQYQTARRIVAAAITKLQVGGSVKFPGGIGWVQRTEGGYMIQGENGQRVAVRTVSEAIEAAASVLAPRVQG